MAPAVRDNFTSFVMADSIAMVLSMCAIGVYFLAAFPTNNKNTILAFLFYGCMLTMAAMIFMVFAFVAGLQAVLYSFELFDGAIFRSSSSHSGALVALLRRHWRHHWKRHSGVVLGAVQALFAAPFQASFRADKRHHWRLRSGAISFRWEVPLRCRCRRQEGTREALPTHDAGSSKAWSAAGVGKLPC
ncbi:hypothetical protein VitviT2T_007387 [Vitis vinifera]|uniref:PGG domain-containing protein n=1 Tax=Vitis vinifera TaxID=29760 RepID=A0ABY9C1F7_VITVI|nr:hypothetical protein VitviT2T_007387 [Vitis vinifera]